MVYSAVPPVPQGEITDWEFRFLTAIKQNVEVLTGQRPGGGGAIVNTQITIQPMNAMQFQQVTASSVGVTISGSNLPLLAEFVKLMVDVQTLGADVATLRATVNALILQLKEAE